jgi:hypothetical protein
MAALFSRGACRAYGPFWMPSPAMSRNRLRGVPSFDGAAVADRQAAEIAHDKRLDGDAEGIQSPPPIAPLRVPNPI